MRLRRERIKGFAGLTLGFLRRHVHGVLFVAPHDDDFDVRDESIPRNVDPLRTNLHNRRNENRAPANGNGGQPDPMRTSIDSMAGSGRRGGGGRGPNRSGGGGYGPRGPGNPGRSFGR